MKEFIIRLLRNAIVNIVRDVADASLAEMQEEVDLSKVSDEEKEQLIAGAGLYADKLLSRLFKRLE